MEQIKLLNERKIIAMICMMVAQNAAESQVDEFGTSDDVTKFFHAEEATLEPQYKIIPGSTVYSIVDQFGNEDGLLEVSHELGRFAYGMITG